MKAKTSLSLLVCGLGIVAAAAGARRDAPGPAPRRSARAVSEAPIPGKAFVPPEDPEPVSDEDRVQDDLHESLGAFLEGREALGAARYRDILLGATADYLGLTGAEEAAFADRSRSSAREIELAWRSRDATILSLPEGLVEEERERLEQEAHERYVQSKRQALARLENSLGAGDRCARFAAGLEQWIDYLVER